MKAFATASPPYLSSPYGTCLGPDGNVYAAYAGNYSTTGGILQVEPGRQHTHRQGAHVRRRHRAPLAVHWGEDGYLYANEYGSGVV